MPGTETKITLQVTCIGVFRILPKCLGNSNDRTHQIEERKIHNTLGILRANVELKHI